MQQVIKTDNTLHKEKRLRDKIKKINNNDVSFLVSWNFRNEVFNIKSYLTRNSKKDQILYIPLNVVSTISTSFADFVLGDGVQVEVSGDWLQDKWNAIAEANDFNELIHNMAIEQSAYWYANVRMRKGEDGNIILEQIPYEYYNPELDNIFLGEDPNVIHIISTRVENSTIKTEEVAKIQTYTKLPWGKWSIEYWIYKRAIQAPSAIAPMPTWTLVNEYQEPEIIDFLNIYTVSNKKMWGWVLWLSDFFDCLDLMEDVNDRLTQMSVQFIKHLNAKLSVPEGIKKAMDVHETKKGETTKPWEMEVYVHRAGEQPAQYIENTNHLMKEAKENLVLNLWLICASIQVPVAFLGVDDSHGSEKVEGIRLRMIRFIKKVARKQSKFEAMIKTMVKDALKFDGVDGKFDVTVKFADSDLTDKTVLFERYLKMFENELLSKKSAIWYMLDMDEKAVDDELKAINDELIGKVDDTEPDPKDPADPLWWDSNDDLLPKTTD